VTTAGAARRSGAASRAARPYTVAGVIEVFGVQRPIVLGPFGGMSSVELTGRVSELGGLGSYGLYGYHPDRIRRTVAELRARTGRPFALNLWVPVGDEVRPGEVELDGYLAALRPLYDEVGVPAPEPPPEFLPEFGDQLDAVLRERPSVVSFVYGVPPAEAVDAAHSAGTAVVGTATTVAEARLLAEGGVDAVVATGFEAGGHRVSFARRSEDSLVGTFALVPQVVDAVDVPVIAAGGVADRRGVRAAFALGARGVQVGTAFLRTRQSAANEGYRRALGTVPADGTRLTTAMSGRLARGIPNRAMRAIEDGGRIAPFPAQNWLTGRFRTPAAGRDLPELQSLWAGQSAPLATRLDADEVFAELVAGLPHRPGS
jgi:nitronate monooxygenase